jgi:hypothetical protein
MIRALLLMLVLSFGLSAPALAKGDAAPPPQFVRFKPIIVTTFNDQDIDGLLSVAIALQAADPAAKDRIELLRPRLQDAFTRALFDLGRLKIDPRRPVDWRLLNTRLQAEADRIVQKDKVRLLVTDVNSRPM